MSYAYFHAGELDGQPTFYREPVGKEHQELEVWMYGRWHPTLPRHQVHDTLAPVSGDRLPPDLLPT